MLLETIEKFSLQVDISACEFDAKIFLESADSILDQFLTETLQKPAKLNLA